MTDDPPGMVLPSEDRKEKLGIVCEATFNLTGTFAAGTPARPDDPEAPGTKITGCWPVGTWTFTAAVAANDCTAAPATVGSYSFRVDRTDDGAGLVQSIATLTTLGDLRAHVSMSENGQGCEGSFELGSTDGKQYWNMQPLLLNTATTAISGSGDYVLYTTDSWPWK